MRKLQGLVIIYLMYLSAIACGQAVSELPSKPFDQAQNPLTDAPKADTPKIENPPVIDKKKINHDFQVQANEFEKENNDIRQEYLKNVSEKLFIENDLVVKVEGLISKVCSFVKKNEKDLKKNVNATSSINSLEKWEKELKGSHKTLEVYKQHMDTTKKNILEEKTRMLELWNSIEAKINAKGIKKDLFQKEDTEQTKKYNEYITCLAGLLGGVKKVSTPESNNISRLKVFTNKIITHIKESKDSEEDKKKEFRNMVAAIFLRRALKSLAKNIDIKKIMEFESNNYCVMTSELQLEVALLGINMEIEMLKSNEKTADLAEIVTEIFKNIKQDNYKFMQEVADPILSDDKIKSILDKKYDQLVERIAHFKVSNKKNQVDMPKNWKAKIEFLKKYHIDILSLSMDAIKKTKIEPDFVNLVDSSGKLQVKKEKETVDIDMVNSTITESSIEEWLGITREPAGILSSVFNSLISAVGSIIYTPVTILSKTIDFFSTEAWDKVMKKKIEAKDADRLTSITKLGQILKNIEKILLLVPSFAIKGTEIKDMAEVAKDTIDIAQTSNALLYTVKYNKMKKATEAAKKNSYVKIAVDFLIEASTSKIEDYKSINMEEYKPIEKITHRNFIIDKKSSEKLFGYIQKLSNDYVVASEHIKSILEEGTIEKYKKELEKMKELKIEEIDPKKALIITVELYTKTIEITKELVDSIKNRAEIKNKSELYTLWKEMIHLDGKINLLNFYTSKEATEVIEEFKKYIKEPGTSVLDKILAEEKSKKEIRKSMFRVETIIISTGIRIPQLIEEAFSIKIESQSKIKPVGNSTESFSEVSEYKESGSGIMKYLIWILVIGLVSAAIGAVGFFFIKGRKEQNSVL